MATISNYLNKMKEIASWSGHIKNFRAFPPPDGEAFISYSMRILDNIDLLTPYERLQNSELYEIRTLNTLIRKDRANNEEDICYSYCQDMVKKMEQYIGRIEEWLDKHQGLL